MALKEPSIRKSYILVYPQDSLVSGLSKLREGGSDASWVILVALENNQYAVVKAGELMGLLQRISSGYVDLNFSDIVDSKDLKDLIPIVASYEQNLISEAYAIQKANGNTARLIVVCKNKEVVGYFQDISMGGELSLDLPFAHLFTWFGETLPEVKTFSATDRYANLWFTARREPETEIDRNQVLVQHSEIFLLFFIGLYDARTILAEARPFPAQGVLEQAFPGLAGQAVPMQVTFFSLDFETPTPERTQKLFLEKGKPTEICYFPIKPLTSPICRGRVCIFYQNHLLQSLDIQARVAPAAPTRDQPHADNVEMSLLNGPVRPLPPDQPHVAHVEMTFSSDFKNPERFSERGLWLGINQNIDGSHALNIKDNQAALSCRQGDAQIKNALKQARQSLLEVSFETRLDDHDKVILDESTGQPKKYYRFKPDNSPIGNPAKRFKEDLSKLADVGSNLFYAVFGKPVPAEEKNEVENIRKAIKEALERPCVIQVCRLKEMGDIWPWALMYDLDLDIDNLSEVCEGFHKGDESLVSYEECIHNCPHRDSTTTQMKTNTVICPYGFWGFKHIIEQPVQPGGKKAFEDLALNIELPDQPVLEMPVESSLLAEQKHITNMKNLKFSVLGSKQEIVSALNSNALPAPPQPQIVYFFCHGGYDEKANPLLGVGHKEKLRPKELEGKVDLQKSHGLVFINGCHTMELAPEDLANIMWPFVNGGAGGIIGTEITVHTYLACPFAEEFFHDFLSLDPQVKNKVGQIIQEIRLRLLARKNPLGLVYTPYCSADLRLSR